MRGPLFWEYINDYVLARNQYKALVSKMIKTENTNGCETGYQLKEPFAFKRGSTFPANTNIKHLR